MERDLGSPELWERSLARSRRRREEAAARRPALSKEGAGALLSAAVLGATLVASPEQPAQAQGITGAGATGGTLLRTGSRGPAVAAAQRALGIPADGIFGPQTLHAVLAFQRAHGLAVDGIIGPVTSAALGIGGGRPTAAPTPGPATTRAVQRAVGVPVDGAYGPVTRAAVIAFQRAHGLVADGIVGPRTLAALGLGAAGPGTGAPSSVAATVVAAVRSKLGAPYAFAGTGPTSFDCSGLTMWAMRQAGVALPRTSYAQFGVGIAIPASAIRAGDLVFFNTDGAGASHVGIATSASSVISATTHGVREHAIFDSYWGSHYVGARRVG